MTRMDRRSFVALSSAAALAGPLATSGAAGDVAVRRRPGAPPQPPVGACSAEGLFRGSSPKLGGASPLAVRARGTMRKNRIARHPPGG